MERYDIAVIGTGPAGLSAAITAKVRNKNIILLGSPSLSEKVQKAHEVLNYLGLPAVSGNQMQTAFLEHIASMGIEITPERAAAVYAMGDYFSIQTQTKMLEASSVILAAGVAPGKLFPGEKELIGRGVSYCATCDASLYRGRSVAVIGYSPAEEAEAEFLSETSESVMYLPMYKQPAALSDKIKVINELPLEIIASGKALTLKTDTSEHTVDGIFILRDSISPEQLVPGLEISDGHVSVNLQMETSIDGCFACGDITGKPYQYIKAAGQGNVAALSAVNWLDTKNRTQKQ